MKGVNKFIQVLLLLLIICKSPTFADTNVYYSDLEIKNVHMEATSDARTTELKCVFTLRNNGPDIRPRYGRVVVSFLHNGCDDRSGRPVRNAGFESMRIPIPELRPGQEIQLVASSAHTKRMTYQWYSYTCANEYFCQVWASGSFMTFDRSVIIRDTNNANNSGNSNTITFPAFKDKWPLRLLVYMEPCEAHAGDTVEFKVLVENFGSTSTPFIGKKVFVLSPAQRDGRICSGTMRRYISSPIISTLPPGGTWINISGQFLPPNGSYNGILAQIPIFGDLIRSPWVQYEPVPERNGYFKGPCLSLDNLRLTPQTPKHFR